MRRCFIAPTVHLKPCVSTLFVANDCFSNEGEVSTQPVPIYINIDIGVRIDNFNMFPDFVRPDKFLSHEHLFAIDHRVERSLATSITPCHRLTFPFLLSTVRGLEICRQKNQMPDRLCGRRNLQLHKPALRM